MKLRFIDRLIIILSALVVLVTALIALGMVWNILPEDLFLEYADRVYNVDINLWPVTGISAGIFILAVGLFFIGFGRSRLKTPETIYIQIGSADGGTLKIAADSLNEMICKNVATIAGVKEAKSKVSIKEGLANIVVGVSLDEGVIVPQISEEIQTTTKEKIQLLTGLNIAEISIMVKNW